MLIDFSFANYKSYRDQQAFTMTRTKPAIRRDTNAWPVPGVSCVAGVYGSNASGKSTFCRSLNALASFVTYGFAVDDAIDEVSKPFLLDPESRDEPTSFSVDFTGVQGRYLYELDVKADTVVSESLRKYADSSNRTRRVYERSLGEDGHYTFLYGKEFKGQKKGPESMTRRDVAYLSVLDRTGNTLASDALSFFRDQFVYLDAGYYRSELKMMSDRIREDADYSASLSTILSQADLGVEVVELENPLEEMRSTNDSAFKDVTRAVVALTSPDLPADERKKRAEQLLNTPINPRRELAFTHRASDGYVAKFGEDDESKGTLAMLAFFSAALDLLSRPTVTFIDEIDTSLHPLYVEELVSLFKDPETNPHQSQLVFTTHDVSLITKYGADEPVIGQDQIWFAEKGEDGASELFPATSLHTRWEENFGRNYLHGVYGAIPIPDFHSAFAKVLRARDE